MSQQVLLTPSIISKESLVILQNNLVAAGKVNRQFENQFVKIGSILTVRKPNRFLVSTGPSLQVQNISEPSTSITINNQQHVDFQFSSQDLTLTVEEFRERYIKPAMEELASALDYGVITNFNQIYNEVGTPGTTPNAFSFLAQVGQRADEEAWPGRARADPEPEGVLVHGQWPDGPVRGERCRACLEGLSGCDRQLRDL